MSTICDGCKQTLHQDDGGARVMITDPTPDFSSISVKNVPTFRWSPTLDLCADCLVKMIASLGLPPETFTPRPPPVKPTEPALAGALTDEDLIKLGLKE